MHAISYQLVYITSLLLYSAIRSICICMYRKTCNYIEKISIDITSVGLASTRPNDVGVHVAFNLIKACMHGHEMHSAHACTARV